MLLRALERTATHVAGVDIGGTAVKVGLFDRQGHLLGKHEGESQAQRGFEHFVGRIAAVLEEGLAANGLTVNDLAGIGLGYPGTVHPETGLISGSPNIPGSEGRNLVQPLTDLLCTAVRVGNDASVAALGECLFGAGRAEGVKHLALFTLGTGVGGGLVIDGQVWAGAHHQGSELGHMIVDPNGPLCGCGNFGCLESFCGTAGILRAAWRRLQQGRPSSLWEAIREFEEPELTPLMIAEAAEQGDAVSCEVWDEVGYYLGLGCVSVINAFDPEMILLGGGVSRVGDRLFDAVRRTVRARQRLNPWDADRIQPAGLGPDAGIVGSAALVLQELGGR